MKYKALAVLAVAGVVGFSGAAFAGVNISVKVDSPAPKIAAQPTAKKLPPKFEQGERPEMPPMRSRDNNMPPPPGAHSRDKRPPELKGKMPPMKRDNNMPPPPGAHSKDKRPPERRK